MQVSHGVAHSLNGMMVMNKTGWIFPGQGSQKIGMGLDFYEQSDLAKRYFDKSEDILNCDIKSIIFNGPENLLTKTENTQPAVYIVSVVIAYLLIQKGYQPTALAGHSLGEYSALTIAGAFDFDTGLKLVKARSESMAKAGLIEKGSMAAIIGMDDKSVESICDSFNNVGSTVVAANYNSPEQIVISGNKKSIIEAIGQAKKQGARLAVELKVSGAFHSPLMSPAREELAHFLNSLEISDASYPVYSNFDAKPIIKSSDIRNSLLKQLDNPVLWYQLIVNMKNNGILTFIEIGPGKVLQGLNKRIDKTLACNSINSIITLEKNIV